LPGIYPFSPTRAVAPGVLERFFQTFRINSTVSNLSIPAARNALAVISMACFSLAASALALLKRSMSAWPASS
jgi:hypothetical protein